MWQQLRAGGGVVVLLILQGCTTTSVINGRFAMAGTPPTPVTLSYQMQPFGAGGTMLVTLPTGEVFTGKYVHITFTSTADVVPRMFWGPGWNDWGPFGYPWLDGDDFPVFVRNYSGKVVATLFGDRGDVMRCRFNLSVPEQGMHGGDVGECQVSNGGQLSAHF
jgi:hypothetical protein